MRVFVTGGTGIVGVACVTELLARGHTVRLFSRHARQDARQWPYGVEAIDGDIARVETVAGTMDDCNVVVHLAAIVAERPPLDTFEAVNVGGTANVVAEAARAGVDRLIAISSLGADRGQSGYHRSKRAAEEIVRTFPGSWAILRLGNVYGGGDQIISLMLTIMRAMPIVPVINGGRQEFQPIWVNDFAEAVGEVVTRTDLDGAHDISGPDRTSMNDLYRRLERITGRSCLRIPMTGRMATWCSRLGERLGLSAPITADQVLMLEEGSVIADPDRNLLPTLLAREPVGLDDGLRRVADSLPEQLPREGVGKLQHRRVWADISNATGTAAQVFERFCTNFSEITPWHMDLTAEPGTQCVIHLGSSLTMALPVRGNVQVRVQELTDSSLTLVTLEGHPLAGAVRFTCRERARGVIRFQVEVFDRSSTFLDWVAMATVGGVIQLGTWKSVVRGAIRASGGAAVDGVHSESGTLGRHATERVERWIEDTVIAQKRAGHAAFIGRRRPLEHAAFGVAGEV